LPVQHRTFGKSVPFMLPLVKAKGVYFRQTRKRLCFKKVVKINFKKTVHLINDACYTVQKLAGKQLSKSFYVGSYTSTVRPTGSYYTTSGCVCVCAYTRMYVYVYNVLCAQ